MSQINYLDEAITAIISNFITYPYDYLYEYDIQSNLYSIIKGLETRRKDVTVTYNASKGFVNGTRPTTLLHREYPQESEKFDICILDDKKVAPNCWKEEAACAIEIKLPDWTLGKYKYHRRH